MIYEFKEWIANRRKGVEYFYDKDNFVGYILPDGSIYQCKEHNVSNVDAVLKLYLEILTDNFQDKDKLLREDVHDRLLKMIIDYLDKASHDQIKALLTFINQNNSYISDLLVELFGCHLVTRLDKTIITSEANHRCFYNYLLNDFTINTIDKIIYDDDKKEYKYVKFNNRNYYLYDEIEKIKKNVSNEEIKLFYKTR